MQRKYFNVFALLIILSLVLAGCAQPVPIAPAESAPATSGEAAPATTGGAAGEAVQGGVWTRTTSSDASTFNPILADGTNSSDVSYMIYDVALVGGDLDTGEVTCDATSFCESFEASEDGLSYTFHLHEGFTWSDGTEMTAQDFVYTWNAIASDLVDSPRKYVWDGISSIETPDDYTVVINYETLTCDALSNLGLGVLPSHIYADDFSNIMDSPENEAPTVINGPLAFQSWERDDNIILVRNEAYRDGPANLDGMIYRVVPDAGSRLSMLQSGESDISRVQPSELTAVEGNPNVTLYKWQDDGYTYVGLNLADPANPQPGLDADGNVIPQAPHPILGDKNVRQAIAYALDYDAIINDIYFGQGFRQTSNVMPAVTWAYNSDLAPYNFDTAQAISLLEAAGWVDSDGDGVREKDGVDLTLRLMTNAGNSARENLGIYMQDALSEIGFEIDFQAIDFGTMLEQMDAQTYDMYIIGWTGLGSDPATDLAFFEAAQDIPGSGFNNISYYNADFEELSAQGRSVEGCAPEDRAASYMQIQEIIKDEVPYIFITGSTSNIGYNSRWDGMDPRPWSASEPVYWNVTEWSLANFAE